MKLWHRLKAVLQAEFNPPSQTPKPPKLTKAEREEQKKNERIETP